jgi:hypothetical protein
MRTKVFVFFSCIVEFFIDSIIIIEENVNREKEKN